MRKSVTRDALDYGVLRWHRPFHRRERGRARARVRGPSVSEDGCYVCACQIAVASPYGPLLRWIREPSILVRPREKLRWISCAGLQRTGLQGQVREGAILGGGLVRIRRVPEEEGVREVREAGSGE